MLTTTREVNREETHWTRFGLRVRASLAPAQDVGYNFDQQADFAKYKTYKWVTVKDAEQVNELVAKQIADAIDRQLATKGLSKATGDTADLYVAFQVAVTKEKQMTTFDTGVPDGAWVGRPLLRRLLRERHVHLDHLDHQHRDGRDRHVRRRREEARVAGMASKQLDPKAKPEKRQKNLDKGMEKLLKNYPPKKK